MEQKSMTGDELRATRKILGLKTQEDLAKLTGYARETLSRMENGHEEVRHVLATLLFTMMDNRKKDQKIARLKERLSAATIKLRELEKA